MTDLFLFASMNINDRFIPVDSMCISYACIPVSLYPCRQHGWFPSGQAGGSNQDDRHGGHVYRQQERGDQSPPGQDEEWMHRLQHGAFQHGD